MLISSSIWRTEDCKRYFIIPDDRGIETGELLLRRLTGERAFSSEQWARQYEIAEEHACRLAKAELEESLAELRDGVQTVLNRWRRQINDNALATAGRGKRVSTIAIAAMPALVARLPEVIVDALSVDTKRRSSAKSTMTQFKDILCQGGIDVGHAFEEFTDRLAKLRDDFESERADGKSR